jgi:hypothetical protein
LLFGNTIALPGRLVPAYCLPAKPLVAISADGAGSPESNFPAAAILILEILHEEGVFEAESRQAGRPASRHRADVVADSSAHPLA